MKGLWSRTRVGAFGLSVCTVTIIAASASVFAQAPALGSSQQSRFLQVALVRVDFTASDSSGQPLLDLRASDVKVFENNVEQTIENFALVSGDAGSYYLLSYHPMTPAPAGKYQRINV